MQMCCLAAAKDAGDHSKYPEGECQTIRQTTTTVNLHRKLCPLISKAEAANLENPIRSTSLSLVVGGSLPCCRSAIHRQGGFHNGRSWHYTHFASHAKARSSSLRIHTQLLFVRQHFASSNTSVLRLYCSQAGQQSIENMICCVVCSELI